VVDPGCLPSDVKKIFNGYLVKPIKMNMLVNTISEFLVSRRLKKSKQLSLKDAFQDWATKNNESLDEFYSYFRRDIFPVCKNIEVSLDLDNVDKLSEVLGEVGQILSISEFIVLGQKLKAYKKTVDIENTLLLIRELITVGELLTTKKS
jgi:hypothetical protein